MGRRRFLEIALYGPVVVIAYKRRGRDKIAGIIDDRDARFGPNIRCRVPDLNVKCHTYRILFILHVEEKIFGPGLSLVNS